jgi:two-component system NtrC family sensor kinase
MKSLRSSVTSFFTISYGNKRLVAGLFVIYAVIAALPLFFIIATGYVWLFRISEEEFELKLRKKTEDISQSLEFFLSEKVSGLRLVSSMYRLEHATDDRAMNSILDLMKQEFSEIVDVGIIDSKGVQIAYAGPYQLTGRDYADHDWFHEVTVRGVYISEVFMGYRKIPHFAIAVKKQLKGGHSFYVWRTTIDVDALHKRIMSFQLQEEDDAFLVNRKGVIQTDSRFSGSLLQKSLLTAEMLPARYSRAEIKGLADRGVTIGYMTVKNTPWVLVMMTKEKVGDRIGELLKRDLSLVYISVLLILGGTVANFLVARWVVSWLLKSDRMRQEAMLQTEHTSKLASIGRLAAGVAHEINNPLAIINEKAGLMRDIMRKVPDFTYGEKFNASLASILQSVSRCRTITHRLLGFARQMDVSHEVLDLNAAIRDVIGFLEREMAYRNIHLELLLDNDLPSIESDRGQLQQVFLNIINNALDAVKDGGEIAVRTSRKDSDSLRVTIKDNGEGIPPQNLERIFEPFFSTKEKGKGTGLGLSITYGIVKKLGGDMQVDSVVGEGTSFVVDLPIRYAGAKQGGEPDGPH